MTSKVNRISAEEAKKLLEKNPEILLLDVRQPEEYQKGHIPGALLIPLPELPDRLEELKTESDIITYCRLGRRSLAAAQLIADELDRMVYTIDGGIMAWNGFIARGYVEEGLMLIEDLHSPEDFLSFAYTLEDGSERFYLKVYETFENPEVKEIFKTIASAEVNHKRTIASAWPGVSIDERFIEYLEGGVSFSEALEVLKNKDLIAVLEYSMQMEINSLDLYMRMLKIVPSQVIDVLKRITNEEKSHLKKLGNILSSLQT